MQSTRQEILQAIKERGKVTVNELAEALDLAPITIRHHLTILENEGLITTDKVRQPVGRPIHVYSLTEAAQDYFPKKYHVLADQLLTELKARVGKREVGRIFRHMADEILTENAQRFQGKTLEERLDILVELLGEEGFLARWEKVGDDYVLEEYSCSCHHLAQQHPQVCCMDHRLITEVLDVPVKRSSWMVDGDNICTFQIRSDSPLNTTSTTRHRTA